MQWTPRKYQEDAIAFVMQRAGSGLLLDPGLGKTSITLACIDILRSTGEIRKTLIIAPIRVCQTVWPAESAKWDDFGHLKVVNLHPYSHEERVTLLGRDIDVYVINPEALTPRNGKPTLLDVLPEDFDMLVVDESTKYKDTQTSRFKKLRQHIHKFKRRIILTGTPTPNGLQDLFGQMFIVDLGASLGKYVTHFRNEFCLQDPSGYGWNMRAGSADLIYRRVANSLMRLDAIDQLAMPELIFNNIPVSLPAKLRGQYHDLEEKFYTELESNPIAVFSPGSVGMKLRQMANGFVYDDAGGTKDRVAHRLHTEKLDALEELVEEMQGRPLLLSYEFVEDRDMIMERFQQAMDLGMSKNPQRLIDQFNQGNVPILMGHPASMGHGLNLQECCHDVCFYALTWNYEYYEQFYRRVWRQGQKNPVVTVHSIVCKGTKDEDVASALGAKGRTQKSFNDFIKTRRA